MIDIELNESSLIKFEIRNSLGQTVHRVNKGKLNMGKHSLRIYVSNLSSGIYFYTIYANEYSITKKLIVE